jgi:hypothetical protein
MILTYTRVKLLKYERSPTMKKLLPALLLATAPICNAAEAVLTGQGKILTQPDYVELNISIHSKCFDTPKDAVNKNDSAAEKLVEYLNSKIDGEGHYNKVITRGGFTQPFQIHQRNKILCENTFQKQNNIILRTQNIKDFESLFQEIQSKAYNLFDKDPKNLIESETTYITMGQPTAKISEDKENTLEQKALNLALQNAKSKLKALFSDDEIQNLKIVHISELPPKTPMPEVRKHHARMMMAESSHTAPVQFDDQWISRTLYFTFSFDTSASNTVGE